VAEDVVAEWDSRTQECQLAREAVRARRELSAFVELPIIRQIRLRRRIQDDAAMDCHGAVEQLLLNKERRADDQQRS
jgi:hypothetical protein